MRIRKVSFRTSQPGTVFNAETDRWVGYQGEKRIAGKIVKVSAFETRAAAALFMNELRGPASALSKELEDLRSDFTDLSAGKMTETEFRRRHRSI
jgi:hypothetical protein